MLQGRIREVEREVEKALAACSDTDPAFRDMVVKVPDFTQQAAEVWRGSKIAGKQRILRAVSLNRTLGDVSLAIEKRKPFSFLTERLPVRTSRGDCPNFEPPYIVKLFGDCFKHNSDPIYSETLTLFKIMN